MRTVDDRRVKTVTVVTVLVTTFHVNGVVSRCSGVRVPSPLTRCVTLSR